MGYWERIGAILERWSHDRGDRLDDLAEETKVVAA
jgi:hypothetical protein